jgi:hypothetical protein
MPSFATEDRTVASKNSRITKQCTRAAKSGVFTWKISRRDRVIAVVRLHNEGKDLRLAHGLADGA